MRRLVPDLDEAARSGNAAVNARIAALLGGGGAPPGRSDLTRLRRQRREGAGPFPAPWRHPGAVDGAIDGPGGPVATRTLSPPSPHGTYVHVAGGGWCTGAADLQDATLWALAVAASVTAVCVAPRLAPEHPFPAPLDDAVAAVRHLLVDRAAAGPIVLGGDSTGAHVALLAAQSLRDEPGDDPLAALVLAVGIYDLTSAATWRNAADGVDPLLGPELLARYVDWFVPAATDRPTASPLLRPLQDLPPMLVVGAGLDPLAGCSRRLADAADAAGVVVTATEYPDASHGFATFDTATARHVAGVQARFVVGHTA